MVVDSLATGRSAVPTLVVLCLPLSFLPLPSYIKGKVGGATITKAMGRLTNFVSKVQWQGTFDASKL